MLQRISLLIEQRCGSSRAHKHKSNRENLLNFQSLASSKSIESDYFKHTVRRVPTDTLIRFRTVFGMVVFTVQQHASTNIIWVVGTLINITNQYVPARFVELDLILCLSTQNNEWKGASYIYWTQVHFVGIKKEAEGFIVLWKTNSKDVNRKKTQ